MIPFNPCELIQKLCASQVEFIVIGGVAATVHGLDKYTSDLDVVYRRTPVNIRAVVEALKPFNPYLRGAVQGLPFVLDEETVSKGLNFTLVSDLGAIDLLADIPGAKDYDELLEASTMVELCGCQVQVVQLDKLIELKRSAGRIRDFEVLAMLEKLRDINDTGDEL